MENDHKSSTLANNHIRDRAVRSHGCVGVVRLDRTTLRNDRVLLDEGLDEVCAGTRSKRRGCARWRRKRTLLVGIEDQMIVGVRAEDDRRELVDSELSPFSLDEPFVVEEIQ